ncbi:hypothetical protein [Microbacterium sp. Gd 4-13]|uniref:hypothetical protein n=1 Tax=Microbacterium sp. Gd 4-13 TaxID=2173179 RepID=UPI0010583096|nr:hypothetical protein [Microbacterium sp. Gd 4-13]
MSGSRTSVGAGARLIVSIVVVGLMAIGSLGASPAASASGGAVPSPAVAAVTPVLAANLANFNPGRIVSDAVFFDSSTMGEQEIQDFLDSKVRTCRSGYTCLKDTYDTTRVTSADAMCGAYAGGGRERASRIIYNVARACGINPQVILVMLEKEQGLVTHTWPSDFRYRAAMGQGCPDTAACDARYYGFFNQVYGAAWQLKRYANPSGTSQFFTWYAPGRTWNVLYHPNRDCGSSPVRIDNQATADLYYYTPYQPNAAALRAGYGEGDGCSSYGNRNFYNYFTDWFGSTETPAAALIKATDANEIYLISGGVRHHVVNSADLAIFEARLGTFRVVPSNYVSSLPLGNSALRLARDARDGAMYLLQPGGTKHHLRSVELVERYGFRMDDYLALSPSLVDKFPTGEAVGDFFRAETSPDYYKWEAGSRRLIVNDLSWLSQRSAARDFVAVMPEGNAYKAPVGVPLLAPGSLTREASSGDVYLVGTGLEIARIPSFGTAADAGVQAYRVVSDGVLAGYRPSGELAPIMQCGSQTVVVDGGALTPIAGAETLQPRPAALPSALCAVMNIRGASITAPILTKGIGADAVYVLDAGKLRHIRSAERLYSINGNRPVKQLTWSPDTVKSFPLGAPHFADNSFVSFGTADIYVAQSGTLRHVLTTAALLRLAGPRWPVPVEKRPADELAQYVLGEPVAQ